MAVRVGIGFDVHRLIPGRQLILGGIIIPYERGLMGHSDADVLTHAVCDALLGATAQGDIGTHFPDTDPRFKDRESLTLLAEVYQLVQGAGFTVGNIDATIVAEAPTLAPYIPRMTGRIAEILHMDHRCISIKATTTEGLGFTGRGEGIAAYAVVVVESV